MLQFDNIGVHIVITIDQESYIYFRVIPLSASCPILLPFDVCLQSSLESQTIYQNTSVRMWITAIGGFALTIMFTSDHLSFYLWHE